MKPLFICILLSGFTFTVNAQKQGIMGSVFWVSGNQMPGPGKENIPQQGVRREILVYRLANLKDVEQTDGFFTTVHTELVARAWSDQEGAFKIKLSPGTYSLFVKESNGLFANLYDASSNINPVVVKAREYTWITIAIDYEASY
jgi:hypothetical protein